MIIAGDLHRFEIQNQKQLDQIVISSLSGFEGEPDVGALQEIIKGVQAWQKALIASSQQPEKSAAGSSHLLCRIFLAINSTGKRSESLRPDSPDIVDAVTRLLEKYIDKGDIGKFVSFYYLLENVESFPEALRGIQQRKNLFVLSARAQPEGFQYPSRVSISTGPERETLFWLNSAPRPFANLLADLMQDIKDIKRGRPAKFFDRQYGLPLFLVAWNIFREQNGRAAWLSGLVPDNADEILSQLETSLSEAKKIGARPLPLPAFSIS